ncbi:hypothetical protein BGX28_006201 [Mortierella sp. GBA30]|nr:hypothetical protein BGX28_006201 [Mortierella sp. GBA30]
MSSLVSQRLSYAELSNTDDSMNRSHYHKLASPTILTKERESELEDMMTDSAIACTPPLDLGSDSGDDDDNDDDECDAVPDTRRSRRRSTLSPSSPPLQPVSILHHRKRKDSREHSTAINLLDRCQGQQEEERDALPALDRFHSSGAQGRRPTVSFDLDEVPLQSKPRLEQDFRHRDSRDDDIGDLHKNSVRATATGPVALANPETIEQLLLTERALRRVSLTPTPADAGNDSDDCDDNDVAIVEPHEPREQVTDTNDTSATVSMSECSLPQETLFDHILHESAPQDMLVALFNRPSEMQTLVAMHSDFFKLINSSLSKTGRDHLQSVLLAPRTELSDRDWMRAIVDQLCSLPPCLLEKFKGIVGWIGPDGDEDEEEEYVLWGEDEYGCRDSSFEQVQLKWLRDLEDFSLETFQKCYPQFFTNARERLQGRRMSHGGDQRDQYVIFCETLQLSREDLPCDNAWTRRIMGCLEKHPEQVLQLKEIIAYEIGYDV